MLARTLVMLSRKGIFPNVQPAYKYARIYACDNPALVWSPLSPIAGDKNFLLKMLVDHGVGFGMWTER